MFTGIIEQTGKIARVERSGSNLIFWIASAISGELKPDQSVSHNGVCLTVEAIENGMHQVTAIDETLQKTNLKDWQTGTLVNIERCMQMNGRLDGHIVQGHVDSLATCTAIREKGGSWEFDLEILPEFAPLVIEKGSVSLNGISLTCFNVTPRGFTVAIIPYTYLHTNMQQLKTGHTVNIEFDIIGKYINRISQLGTAN